MTIILIKQRVLCCACTRTNIHGRIHRNNNNVINNTIINQFKRCNLHSFFLKKRILRRGLDEEWKAREGRGKSKWKKEGGTNDDGFRGNNLTRSFLHHWPRFYVRGSEHGPPVDFHTAEEWVMPNLHIACDFVFDVTRSLLIMQWTRCEYDEDASLLLCRLAGTAILYFPPFPSLYSIFLLIYLFVYIFSSDFFRFQFGEKENCLS